MNLPKKPAVVSAQVIALSFDTITMGGDLHTGKLAFIHSQTHLTL
jgi:hypothetical protein